MTWVAQHFSSQTCPIISWVDFFYTVSFKSCLADLKAHLLKRRWTQTPAPTPRLPRRRPESYLKPRPELHPDRPCVALIYQGSVQVADQVINSGDTLTIMIASSTLLLPCFMTQTLVTKHGGFQPFQPASPCSLCAPKVPPKGGCQKRAVWLLWKKRRVPRPPYFHRKLGIEVYLYMGAVSSMVQNVYSTLPSAWRKDSTFPSPGQAGQGRFLGFRLTLSARCSLSLGKHW